MDRGLDRRFLRRCLLATGWVSAFIALTGWRLTGFDWAGRYAASALFAWVNWGLLAHALLALVERRWIALAVAGSAKAANILWFVGLYLPLAGAEPISLLLGLNTFFLVIAMKLLGRHLTHPVSRSFSQNSPSRRGKEDADGRQNTPAAFSSSPHGKTSPPPGLGS